ncbi:hybrid sensor histidine kinase/response regulator [Fodinibius sp. Rm-B-1B1-1]|uniref:hybrid sensor histidine kinase/response regulator n=1 Tax=Fodinibius alkaliphilus TaxID=3140241 RepID=UPI00315A97F3
MEESIEKKNGDFLILIADDIPKNIQLLGKVLDNNGYQVVAVTEGDRVLDTAKKHNPDLILLDIMMPEKSGYEVCKELQANEELSEIPIIFLTARSDEEDIIKGLNLGGSDYVTKPFNSGELLARIDTHLSLKEARDQIVEQREELQQLSETKDKLYSIIAHDLKGALFGISGIAEILEDDLKQQDVDEEIKDNIALIHQSAHSANQLLENLLVWTRMQTDLLEINEARFSLSDCIRECIELYDVQAREKQIQFEFESEAIMVHADREMISTVFRNLISNAIKFSNAGDTIHIKADSTNGTRKVTVRDEGVGMTEEVRQNIFNPGDRPKREGTEREKGTGLGLLLCKEFVERHNGEISVESEPDEGTVFRITLPEEAVMQNGQPAG